MKKGIKIGFITILLFSLACNNKNNSDNIDNQITTYEEATARLDSLKNKDTASLPREHIRIYPNSNIFNKKEANLALDALIERLKYIGNPLTEGQSIFIDSYDATDSCYIFSIMVPSEDEKIESVVSEWWLFFPKSNKIIRQDTFNETK